MNLERQQRLGLYLDFSVYKFFGEKGTLHDFSQVIAPTYFHETSFFDSAWDGAQHFARRAVGK